MLLTLYVCSILHGAQCREEYVPLLTDSITPHQCMMYGQLEIVRWQESHLNWRVHRWSCGPHRIHAKA